MEESILESLELQSTFEQVKRTYCQDTIGRNKDLHRFIEMINSVNDSCVIALDGNWGSGKTFFVKQAKMILDAHNSFISSYEKDDTEAIKKIWKDSGLEIDLKPQISVYYDAWENDNDEDPILSIIYEILKVVGTDYTFTGGASLVKIAVAIAESLTGKKIQSLIEAAKQEDPFSYIKSAQDFRESISRFFDSLLPEQGERLVVFIDELDRCTPSFAVKLLERIKHYFFKDKITFVLSINTHELQNTVRQYYGYKFDACRYLDRFFDLRVSIPPVDLQSYYQSINFDTSCIYDMVADEVIRQYHFEPREIAKYIRLLNIAAYEPTHDSQIYDFSFSEEVGVHFCLVAIVPILIGLKMMDNTRYKAFVEGKDSTPLTEIMGKGEIGKYAISSLLGRNETYEENKEGLETVSLNDKLEQVYDALFIQEYQRKVYESSIGTMKFNRKTKSTLMRTIGLLSGYANYS